MEQNDGGGNNAGGSGNDSRPQWLDSLPDAHKQNQTFYGFKEPAQAWDKFDSLLKAEGNSVVIPGEKATDEERAAFYQRIGRPETPDKYTINRPADFPEAITYSAESEAAFKQQAHKAGLSDAQAKDLYGWYCGMAKQGYEKFQQDQARATEESVNKLKDEWKGDAFKINTEKAARAFKRFGGENPEVQQFIEGKIVDGVKLGDHPVFLKVFAQIADAISDDTASGRNAGASGEMSDEEKAKARFPNTYKK